MKRLFLPLILIFILAGCGKPAQQAKPCYMWFDCEANYERLSYPDSIRYYLQKVKDIGFTDVVVDLKSIMGEVLYESDIAPYMGDWEGHTRPRDYDMFRIFLDEGHKMGLKVHSSLNIFAGGHNYFDRGIIYGEHADWQSIVSWHGRLMPISEMKWNYNGMLNPANPEVQAYQLDVLREFARKYPDADGIIFDRVRFDNITSDFSELSRELFQDYSGAVVENYPDDILYWTEQDGAEPQWQPGPLFNKWVEWRAMVIHDFIAQAHKALREESPGLLIGDYTGAWYPTYYHVGVNWASREYDPSLEFDWATPEYKNSGYAEMLDIYMTGLYYTLVTKDEVDKATGVVGQRTEAGMDDSRNYWYCVEGGAELAKEITRGVVPVTGSLYVEQYEGDEHQFERAVAQTLKSSDGLMIFDIVHIINRDWWETLERGMREAGI